MDPIKTAPKRPKEALRTRMTQEFEKAHQSLNAAQKKAVETIDGPVMVVAGPGTGKTQTLAMRVAMILQKTQMKPSNILCLTFSTSGAKAMRERLRAIIGPDAYGVTIETVHGFCNEIILAHPHIFEDFRALEKVSEIEQLRIIRKLMNDLGPGSILGKPSLEHDRSSAIIHRISEMKREGISPDDLRRVIPEFRAEIETTKNGKKRDTESQSYKDDCRLVQQFEECIQIYQEYSKELFQSHRYDYADMILIVIEAFKRHDWLLAALQERYQYILVDEFQDLNGAQYRVIEKLTDATIAGEEPNIFVVGDDDQAIYRFQGASPANMMKFLTRFPDASLITLTENYRSTQSILDSAAKVIENNEERLVNKVEGLSKDLQSVGARHALPLQKTKKPVFLRFPAIENERAGIAKILKDAHAQGIPWTEMAVLCRRNSEVTEMFDALFAAEIPVILTAKEDLLLHGEVRQAIILLRAIEHLDQDAILSAALACKTLACPLSELGKLWCAHRELPREKRTSLRAFLRAQKNELSPSLQKAYDLLEELSMQRASITLPELLEKLLKDSGLLPRKEDTSADPRRIAGLHAFYDYVKGRVYENKGLTLTMLLGDLDQYLSERTLKLEYAAPHIVSDGVSLMTAHGAKGLEFELVIVPHLRFRNWGNSIRGSLLSLPDHLIFGIETAIAVETPDRASPAPGHDWRTQEKNLKQEDERRLMYVAMTRAKNDLILTFPETFRSDDEIKDAQPSVFLAEAGSTVREKVVPADEVQLPIDTLHMPALAIDEAFRAFLMERLLSFRLSVTALNAFLRDPQEFLWVHLLQQPQAKAGHLAFGTVIHAALEKRNLAMQSGTAFSTTDLIETFTKTLSEREVFTESEHARYLYEGKLILKRYGEETAIDSPIILSAERAILADLPHTPFTLNGTEYSSIPLFGKVDRIDLFQKDGQYCRVIDYKTGAPKKTDAAVRKEGDLFRQLVFYKLLCDLSPGFSHTATHFTLDFIGNEKEGRRIMDFEITAEEVQELTELMKNVWGKIASQDFTSL